MLVKGFARPSWAYPSCRAVIAIDIGKKLHTLVNEGQGEET